MQALGAYRELTAQYEAKYRGCRRRGAAAGRRAAVWDVPGLVALCDRCAALAPDACRQAVWRGRTHMHPSGQRGRVYDGTDAVKRAGAMRRVGAA